MPHFYGTTEAVVLGDGLIVMKPYETIFAGGWTPKKTHNWGDAPSYVRGFTTHLATLF
jgi:hypothetical protein